MVGFIVQKKVKDFDNFFFFGGGGELFEGSLWGYTLWGINGMHPDMYLVLLCATNSKILINFLGWGYLFGGSFWGYTL